MKPAYVLALRLAGSLSLCLSLCITLNAKELITLQEARLPEYGGDKAVFPGPKVIQLSPDANAAAHRSPIHLSLKFEMRGSESIRLQ